MSQMLRDTKRGAALPRLGDLSLAELVDEVVRLGGDPTTTLFRVRDGYVSREVGDYDVRREAGVMVVEFNTWWGDEDDD